jgi:hypothetical protein
MTRRIPRVAMIAPKAQTNSTTLSSAEAMANRSTSAGNRPVKMPHSNPVTANIPVRVRRALDASVGTGVNTTSVCAAVRVRGAAIVTRKLGPEP